MGVKEALDVLAEAAGTDLAEVRSIRYIGRTGRLDVSTADGTVQVEVPDEPSEED